MSILKVNLLRACTAAFLPDFRGTEEHILSVKSVHTHTPEYFMRSRNILFFINKHIILKAVPVDMLNLPATKLFKIRMDMEAYVGPNALAPYIFFYIIRKTYRALHINKELPL